MKIGTLKIGPCRDPVPKPGILLDSVQFEIGKRDIKDIQISTPSSTSIRTSKIQNGDLDFQNRDPMLLKQTG